MPNRRKPLEIKKLQGTYDASRVPKNLVSVVEGAPPPPVWLSERAAEIFQDHWAMICAANVQSAVDVTMLALLASRLEEVERTTLSIEDSGRMIKRKGPRATYDVVNPAIKQRNEAMIHAAKLLNEFGLSPAARVKVAANGPKRKANPFLDF